jgi:hypothetical protein
LELNGIASVMTSWNPGKTRSVAPPRATITNLPRGATLGQPGDPAQQRRVLEATLALLSQDTPLEPVYLEES